MPLLDTVHNSVGIVLVYKIRITYNDTTASDERIHYTSRSTGYRKSDPLARETITADSLADSLADSQYLRVRARRGL